MTIRPVPAPRRRPLRAVVVSAAAVAALMLSGTPPAQAQQDAELTGTVTAQTGGAVDGATAVLCSVEPDVGGGDGTHGVLWGTADTEGNGAFAFTDVPDGDYVLKVFDPSSHQYGENPPRYLQGMWLGGPYTDIGPSCLHESGGPQLITVHDGEDIGGLDVALPVGGRVSGLTTDRAGHPIDRVYFSHPRYSGIGLGAGYSGRDVEGYRTVLMEPGRRKITFEAGNGKQRVERSIAVTVETGDTTEVDVKMPLAGNTIRGTWAGVDTPKVLRPGSTLTPRDIYWWHDGTDVGYQWLRDGNRIPGATDRAYQVTATDAGHDLSLRITGRLGGLPPQRYESDPIPVPDVIVELRLLPDTAPTSHPERIHAMVIMDAVSGRPPAGTIKLWDPLGIQEDRGYEPYPAGEGRVGADGTAEISFNPDLFWDLEPYYGGDPSSEVWAEFIPDDSELNGGRSGKVGYQLTHP